jgi:hypothetical protein
VASESNWISAFRAVLDASVWKTAALCIAAAIILYGNAMHWFPVVFQSWIVELLLLACVICGCLALSAIVSNLVNIVKRGSVWESYRAKRLVRDNISYMTARECEIISYLLKNNQRMFETTADAGYASTLVSKGIIVRAVRPGQQVRVHGVPFEIPLSIWKALLEHRAEFPDAPGAEQTLPWAIPWQAR